MSLIQNALKEVVKKSFISAQCGCSQIQFGTTPPVTMMANIVSEGEQTTLVTRRENSLMKKTIELTKLAVFVKEHGNLIGMSVELKELKAFLNDPIDVIEVTDVIQPLALMNTKEKKLEELIGYVTKTPSEIAVRDVMEHVELMNI